MKELTHIREQLAAILRYHTISSPDAQGTLALIDATGLSWGVVENALQHGVIECTELVLLCQALDLDAASVLAEAVNHVCPPLDLRVEQTASYALSPTPDLSLLTPAQRDGQACIHCGRDDTKQVVSGIDPAGGGQLFECAAHHGCKRHLPSHAAKSDPAPQPEEYPA